MKTVKTNKVSIVDGIARINGEVYTSSVGNFVMSGNYELDLDIERFPYEFKVTKITPLENKIQSSKQFLVYLKDLSGFLYYSKNYKVIANNFTIWYHEYSEAKIYLYGNYIGTLHHGTDNVEFRFTTENRKMEIVDLLFNSCGFYPIVINNSSPEYVIEVTKPQIKNKPLEKFVEKTETESSTKNSEPSIKKPFIVKILKWFNVS